MKFKQILGWLMVYQRLFWNSLLWCCLKTVRIQTLRQNFLDSNFICAISSSRLVLRLKVWIWYLVGTVSLISSNSLKNLAHENQLKLSCGYLNTRLKSSLQHQKADKSSEIFGRNFKVGNLETGNRWCESSGMPTLLKEYIPVTFSSTILTCFYYSVKDQAEAPLLAHCEAVCHTSNSYKVRLEKKSGKKNGLIKKGLINGSPKPKIIKYFRMLIFRLMTSENYRCSEVWNSFVFTRINAERVALGKAEITLRIFCGGQTHNFTTCEGKHKTS